MHTVSELGANETLVALDNLKKTIHRFKEKPDVEQKAVGK